MIRGKNILLLMDSSLEGQYANEDASKLVDLASKCLQFEARDRPNIKYLLSSVGPLQKQKEVSSSSKFFPWYPTPSLLLLTLSIPVLNPNLGSITCLNGYYKSHISIARYSFSTWEGLLCYGSYSGA